MSEKKQGYFKIDATVEENGDIDFAIGMDKISTQQVVKIMFSAIAHLNGTLKGFEKYEDQKTKVITEEKFKQLKEE